MGNLKNFTVAILVALPSLIFYLAFLHSPSPLPLSLHKWCSENPLLLANLLFFLNVNALFHLVALLQSLHWLIDLYWTVIPVMLVHYYGSHPYAVFDGVRSRVVVALTWVWSVRLTHNYIRREGWQWGKREDWRFAEMRVRFGWHWCWIGFFVVYVSQQIFLMGVCLPMYAIHSSDEIWNIWDVVATAACIIGITIAYFADTQLYNFVTRNSRLKELGKPAVPTLDSGLWHYSRHPNYFGEQLWWWGLFIFGWNTGHRWTFVGPLVNSLCLVEVTKLVERRMLEKKDRAEAYKQYQKTTSVSIPWFKIGNKGPKHKPN